MARPRHQSGWITEHGNKIYGHFWRYVIDPVTKRRKRTFSSTTKIEKVCKVNKRMAPQVGLEPTTLRLTASWDTVISNT